MTEAFDYLKIGLTGGIGSGKTTVAKRFAALGARVYHADEISRCALDPGAACYAPVVAAFGREILRPDATIDRRRLGEIVFADAASRRVLNEIIHPYVIDELFSRAKQERTGKPGDLAVFEVPLLFESGMHASMDHNIVVFSREENRIRRVMERDALPREQIIARIRAQLPEKEALLLADSILENNDTEEALLHQVDSLYQKLIAGGALA